MNNLTYLIKLSSTPVEKKQLTDSPSETELSHALKLLRNTGVGAVIGGGLGHLAGYGLDRFSNSKPRYSDLGLLGGSLLGGLSGTLIGQRL